MNCSIVLKFCMMKLVGKIRKLGKSTIINRKLILSMLISIDSTVLYYIIILKTITKMSHLKHPYVGWGHFNFYQGMICSGNFMKTPCIWGKLSWKGTHVKPTARKLITKWGFKQESCTTSVIYWSVSLSVWQKKIIMIKLTLL